MKTRIETIYEVSTTGDEEFNGETIGFFEHRNDFACTYYKREKTQIVERQRLIFPDGRSFLLALTSEFFGCGTPFTQPVTVYKQYPPPPHKERVFATRYKNQFLLWGGKEKLPPPFNGWTWDAVLWNGRGKFPRSKYQTEDPARYTLFPAGLKWLFALGWKQRLFVLEKELFETDFQLPDTPSQTVHGWVREGDRVCDKEQRLKRYAH